MPEKKGTAISRRRVLQSAAVAAGGLGLNALGLRVEAAPKEGAQPPARAAASAAESMIGVPFDPRPVVRVGLIGHGGRGGRPLPRPPRLPRRPINPLCH